METRLPPDFSAFLSSLNDAGVDYLVVGGYAVGSHGCARATGDLGLWIRQTPENATRAVAAISAFGFDTAGLSSSRFLGDGKITRMGLPPDRIEVMTSIDGVSFDECWRRRVVSDWDGLPVPVIDLKRLRINKRTSGRPKDLAGPDALPDASDG